MVHCNPFRVSAKFGTCTVVGLNGTLFEATYNVHIHLEFPHFIFNKCPIYNHDGAIAKFSPCLDEPDCSVVVRVDPVSSQ